MYDDVTTRNESGELAVRTVSATEGSNTSSYDDVFTRTTDGKLAMRVVGNGGGGGGAVSSVNGKTGAVVLNAEDVGALPEDTPIPDPQVQSDWDQTDPEAVDYIKNKPVIPQGGIPQYSTMPEATVSNVGEIAQYSGESIEGGYEAEQTSGSDLESIEVDSVEFESHVEGVEGPYVFNYDTTGVVAYWNQGEYNWSITSSLEAWDNLCIALIGSTSDATGLAYNGDDNWALNWSVPVTTSQLESYGLVISGTPNAGEGVFVGVARNGGWLHSWVESDFPSSNLNAYGITYTGTPVNGDQITVNAKDGFEKGYFYVNQPKYGEPSATISQTVGTGLSDLSVDVDRFVEAEQPTQSGNTSFVADVVESSVVFNVVAGNFTVSIPYWGLRQLFIDKGLDWDDNSAFWDAVFTFYNNGTQCGFGPSAGSDWVFIEDIATTAPNYGLVITGSPDPQLEHNYATYSARDGSTTWSKNGVTVDLSAYGVSYNNAPHDGDTLTVAYVAPSVVGYGWNQINVQPMPEGGIEWETKVDLPAEYTGNEYNAAAYFTIKNGLPDGEYEFYYSVKVRPNSNSLAPDGEVIYKVKFKIDNSLNQAMGSMGYVFDGNYMNSGAKEYGGNVQELWGWCRKNNNDLIIYSTGNVFTTDILAMNSHQAVSECFKLSAIKNVETGEKYIAEGDINLDGSEPERTIWMEGNLMLRAIVSVYIPTRVDWKTWYLSDFLNNQSIYTITDTYAFFTLSMIHEGSNSEFIVNLVGKGGGNGVGPYSQEIVKATGVFSNCHLEVDDSRRIWVIGVNAPTTATGTVKVCIGGLSQDGVEVALGTIPTTTPIAQVGPQGAILGTITAETVGNVVQYVGDTNSSYTNGYFYKANGTVVTVPESMETTVTDPVGEATVTINATNLITSMGSVYGWSREQIVQWIKDYPNGWNVDFDVDNNTVTRLYAPFNGDFYDSSILQSVSVAYTGSSTGTVNVIFNESYTPESKTVQNPSWVRVDVQPSSGGGAYLPLSGGTMTGEITLANGANIIPDQVYNGASIGTKNKPFGRMFVHGLSYGTFGGQESDAFLVPVCFASETGMLSAGILTFPTPSDEYDGVVFQALDTSNGFVFGHNYTCVSDGQNPATWSWVEVETQSRTRVNTTVTLAAANWSSNTQTVSVTGMTADGVVFVNPTPANQSAYTGAGILCTAQAAGSLTFTCDTVPSADITVTVVML